MAEENLPDFAQNKKESINEDEEFRRMEEQANEFGNCKSAEQLADPNPLN